MTRPIFLRPIEITTDNNSFTVDDGGGADAGSIAVGTYGNILAVIDAFETALETAGGDTWTLSLTSDFYLTMVADANWTIVWTDTALADLLGFGPDSGTSTTGTQFIYTTATMTPSHLWFPSYTRTNQSFWTMPQRELVQGVNAASGAFAGLGIGTDRREMRFDFQYEPNTNIAEEFATTSYEIDRNFDTFVYQVRASKTSDVTAAPTGGCYVYPDYTDAVPASDVTANQGVQYGLSSGADTHTFCHMLAKSPLTSPSAALPATRQLFNVSMNFVVADEPTWDN